MTETLSTPGRSTTRRDWLFEMLLLAGLLVAGVALAFIWRGLDPETMHLGSNDETYAANDGTLILLGPLAGVLSGGVVLLWPGSAPLTRTVVAIVGSTLGAVLTWQVGDAIADPNLRAVAATFVWPFVTSVVLFFGALLPGTSGRLQPPPRPFHPGQPFGQGQHGQPWGWGDHQVSVLPLPERPAPDQPRSAQPRSPQPGEPDQL
jgi:hypothetical protein